jgi:hypothetical protein
MALLPRVRLTATRYGHSAMKNDAETIETFVDGGRKEL